MEIKKADSKGRVSGFDKERYYQIDRVNDGTVILVPLHEGGYTGTRDEAYGTVHEAVYYLHPGTAEEAEMLLNQAMAKKERIDLVTKRAPLQATRGWGPAGTISWEEHLAVWGKYADRYGSRQSAERIAERGGFGHKEVFDLTGHRADSFEPTE